MHTTNYKKFKGEIENYGAKEKIILESRIDRAFHTLNFKTQLNLVKIIKKNGYYAGHLLYILALLLLLKISTVRSFCEKQWYHWSASKKDSFNRFKHSPYLWREFMCTVIIKISATINFEKYTLEKPYFMIDDTVITKRGWNLENVSCIHDHNLG